MSKTFALVTLALAFVLAGCNTVKGVGQDVQRAGGATSAGAQFTCSIAMPAPAGARRARLTSRRATRSGSTTGRRAA